MHQPTLTHQLPRRRALGLGIGAAAAVALSACAPSSAGGADTEPEADIEPSVDADFDLDALTAAAKKEGSLTVYDSSGDVKKAAELFEKTYGIHTTGVKSKASATLEKLTREYQADNVTIDAVLYEDGPSLAGQLLPQHIVYTWIPGDLADKIASEAKSPLNILDKAYVFTYNTSVFPDGPPIKNIWDVTTDTWHGKLAMQDPLGKSLFIQFFNQATQHASEKFAAAYQDAFGTSVPGGADGAVKEWVKRVAASEPILTGSDGDAEDAVAAPNQTQPRIGLFSNAKFRDIKAKGYTMSVCTGLDPWPGFAYPKYAAIATKTPHPNAAKLFVRFMLTQKGIDTENYNGGTSPNSDNTPGPNPKGLDSFDKLFHFDPTTLSYDYEHAQEMQDFWRTNHG